MSPNEPLIEDLILKYAGKREMSAAELAMLENWRSQSDGHRTLPDLFRDPKWVRENLRKRNEIPSKKMWQHIVAELDLSWKASAEIPWWRRPQIRKLRIVVKAAGIFILVWASWQFIQQQYKTRSTDTHPIAGAPAAPHSRLPDHYDALLTLGNGDSVVLDGKKNGRVAVEGNAILTKTSPYNLVYEASGEKTSGHLFNSLSTGRSAPFILSLPDGSKVTLKDSSSIYYPVTFDENRREVSFSGQAYFDIRTDKKRPFVINAGGVRIEALGTRFYVKAYPGMPASEVALLEGSVQLVTGLGSRKLKPLEQGQIMGKDIQVRSIGDTLALMVWRGERPSLSFEDTELPLVINAIARAYGVHVSNPRNIRGISVKGIFFLDDPLQKNLQVIEKIESGQAYLRNRNDSIIMDDRRRTR